FLFYVFWELMLIPMYVMIGVWGSHDRIKAAVKFFLYTMAGSVLMLAAIIYLVYQYTQLTGSPSFDLLALNKVLLPKNTQILCFWAFAIAFFIKVPMFPVHTWLPDAHVQAPTGGSIILAAVLLKMGTYAYMRFAMGLFPWAAGSQAANLAGVAVLGGIIYGALCSWKQDDFKRLIAYSSVAHLGYVMLGLFANTQTSTQGALLQMVNHGVSTGALFLLVGVIYDRRHTREIAQFGGLAKVMPVYATIFIIVTMASVGVPGTNGFVGEFMVIMGTYTSPYLGKFAGLDAVLAAFGVILAAVYMLSVVQKVFFGPLKNPKNFHLPDLNTREIVALTPLLILIFVIGFFPSTFLSRSSQAVSDAHTRGRLVWDKAQVLDHGSPKLLTNETLAGGHDAILAKLNAMDEGAPRPKADSDNKEVSQ
ncbi:MAG: NADH-quinone oxidoreductase subunit M, partial [Sorangium cellulosum]